MGSVLVGVAAALGVLLLAFLALMLGPTLVAERRRAAHRDWVGIQDLTPREINRVIELRYGKQRTWQEARVEILAARAIAEERRREVELSQRSRGVKVRRARGRRR